MAMIDVWAVLTDPDIPGDVGQRLLTRQAAAQLGLPTDPIPVADRAYLARHIVTGRPDSPGEVS